MVRLSLRDPADTVRAWGEQFRIGFPVWLDPGGHALSAFGMRGHPSTVVIDRGGRVVGRVPGERDWTSSEARRHQQPRRRPTEQQVRVVPGGQAGRVAARHVEPVGLIRGAVAGPGVTSGCGSKRRMPMERVSVSLCPACSACPEVEIAGEEVRIGEPGNLAVLGKEAWNVLVDLIRTGTLSKI
jgi:hypothetical protein